MTSNQIATITAQANAVGEKFKVQCRYEYSRTKRAFVWNYYRHGIKIGSTARPGSVVSLMEKFTQTT